MSVGWIILLLAVGLSQDGLSDFLSEMNFQSFMLFALPPFLLLGIGYFMRWVFRGFRWPSQLRNLSRSVGSVISGTTTWPLVCSVLSVTVGVKSFLTNGCPLVRKIWITWTRNLNVGNVGVLRVNRFDPDPLTLVEVWWVPRCPNKICLNFQQKQRKWQPKKSFLKKNPKRDYILIKCPHNKHFNTRCWCPELID